MSAPIAKAQEPSMEDILASIRRIIADDQELGRPGADRVAGEADGAGDHAAAPETEPGTALDAAPDETPPSEPIADPLSIEMPASTLDLDAGDLTFGEPLTAAATFSPEPEPAREVSRPEAPTRLAGIMADVEGFKRPETLISTEATASIGQAFNMLSHTVLTANARTLEDLVKDMLKPMLKTWLDDNLPPLVERLVRAEIERVARGR